MKSLKFVLTLSLALSGLGTAQAAEPVDISIVTKCESCHGLRGDSTKGSIPRLNGQQAGYLQRRFEEFQDPLRDPSHKTYIMGANTATLIDVYSSLASYFSSQSPTLANGQAPLASQGEYIFQHGVGQDVPACQFCHGTRGEGVGITPRITGQHAEYLTQQLKAFASGIRFGDPVDRHAWRLDDAQLKALTAYLADK